MINSNIYGTIVDTDSKVVSPATSIGAVSAGSAAVAAGRTGDFMAVFDDMPLGADRDIYGRLWGDRVYLPFLNSGR